MSAAIQGSEEWLEFRRSKIGASDAPIIMGDSPWKSAYQLWEEKLGLRENAVNGAMRRGLEMEEEARQEFEKQTGLVVFPSVEIHREHEWMIASLDGIDIERKNIVEIKCPGKQDHECAMDGAVPTKYYAQLQHQMEGTGLDKCHYFSYHRNSSKVLEVKRDKDFLKTLIQKELDFLKCVQELTAPELSDSDYSWRNDDVWQVTVTEWKSIQEQLQDLEKRDRELRAALVTMCNGSNSQGAGVHVRRFLRKGNVDYSQIPELQDVDLEKYRKKPTEYWRIGRER